MADIGRAALTIGGAYFFGPLGAIAGGIIGNLVFPQKLPDVKGPRIKEATIQRSTVGAPLPIVYGTQKIAGNINWWSDLIEVATEEDVGGKGGGPSQSVTNYAYFVDFSLVLCDGEDGRPSKPQGIRRIWAYGNVIYDLTPQADDESDEDFAKRVATSEQTAAMMTIRPGDEDQVASPLIESYEGAGNVPAFRGYYCVEFERFPLNEYGKVLPQLTFEVYTGTVSEEDCTVYSGGNLEPWQFQLDSSVYDPRNPLNHHVYAYTELGGSTYTTLAGGLAQINAVTDHPSEPFILGDVGDVETYAHGWSTNSSPNQIAPCHVGSGTATIGDWVTVQITINSVEITNRACGEDVAASNCAEWWGYFGGRGSPVHIISSSPFASTSGVVVATNHDQDPAPYFGGVPFTSNDSDRIFSNCNIGGEIFDIWKLQSHQLAARRTIEPPDPCLYGAPLANAPGYCVVDGEVVRSVTWTLTAGTFKVLQAYDDDGTEVLKYPVDPCLPSTDPDYNDQDFWEAGYAADQASASPKMAPGLTYGVDYPEVVSSAYVGECTTPSIETVCVDVADIVEDLCDRAGLTAVDVSDVQSCLEGYTCNTRPGMTARDSIEPLRSYGLFDVSESVDGSANPILKFIERGHASVDTLIADELRAHASGGEAPSAVEVTRVQEKDLPRRVIVQYLDIERDHEPGEQSASRLATEATSELVVQLPISMTAETAAQLADIYLSEFWVGRNTYRFTVDNSKIEREVSDCVEIPVDGELERVRITGLTYVIGGILQAEGIRDDQTVYTSTAAAIPSEGSGNGGGAGGNVVCPSEVVLLDLPSLREGIDTDCGFYAAIYGTCASWTCAALYRSNDDGASYGRVARTERQAIVGTITDISGFDTGESVLDTSVPNYDTSNEITISMDTIGGDLSSVSDALIVAGYNAAAVGDDGRWCIIQFKTVTPVTDGFVLSDLLWGLRDTGDNQLTLETGDRFVLLNDAALLRISETFANDGVEKQYKVVTCGETVDDVDPITFATGCLSYEPDLVSPDPPTEDSSVTSVHNPSCSTILIWNSATQKYEPGPLRIFDACDLQDDTSSYSVGDHIAVVDSDTSGPIFGIVPDTGGGGGITALTGDVTASGTGSVAATIANNAVTYAKLQASANASRILAATTATNFSEHTLSAVLDFVGSAAQGDILYRNGTIWTRLAAGTSGHILRTAGAGADPSWASIAAASGATYGVYCTSNQAKTNDTSLADDNTLVVTLLANRQYKIVYKIYISSSVTPDLKYDFNFTGTSTSFKTRLAHTVYDSTQFASGAYTTGTGVQYTFVNALNVARVFTVSGTDTLDLDIICTIEVGASGGTFSFRWAQNTTSGNATTRLRDSCLVVTEI